jgi:aminopeptidase N
MQTANHRPSPARLVSFSLFFSFFFFLSFSFLITSCNQKSSTPTPPAATSVPTSTTTRTPLPALRATPTATLPPPPAPADGTPTAVISGRSIGDPYTPELGNTGYDVQRYTLRLALDPAEEFVTGSTQVEAVAAVDGLTQVSLDFIGYTVETVTVGQTAVPSSREGDKLIFDLPTPLAAGEPFTATIVYEGQPVYEPSRYLGFIDHLGLSYPGQNSIFVLSEPDGARYWFPNNDHPRDKATFRFELTVPAGLTAVANGTLLETRPADGGDTLFIWEHNYPMAPYLALAAVGDYVRLDGASPDGVPLRHYVFPDMVTQFERTADSTGEALDWMSDLFGPYPFEEFGFVTAHVNGVSLETQTMVLLSDGMVDENTLVHELAHMWFGNWVSLDSWSNMWRNEGFATYISFLWETRDDPEALELQMAAIMELVEENGPVPLNDLPPDSLFGFDSYIRGAALVHSLRLEMGDEPFFAGLRLYMERFGGRTASQADFEAVMEEAAGRSLEEFFVEWLGEER